MEKQLHELARELVSEREAPFVPAEPIAVDWAYHLREEVLLIHLTPEEFLGALATRQGQPEE